MPDTWYDPDELKAQAVSTQTQPEFAPSEEPDDSIEEAATAIAFINEHQEMTARFLENLVNP